VLVELAGAIGAGPLRAEQPFALEHEGEEADQPRVLGAELGPRLGEREEEGLGRQLERAVGGVRADAGLEDLDPAAGDEAGRRKGGHLGLEHVAADDFSGGGAHEEADDPVAFDKRPTGDETGGGAGLQGQFHGGYRPFLFTSRRAGR